MYRRELRLERPRVSEAERRPLPRLGLGIPLHIGSALDLGSAQPPAPVQRHGHRHPLQDAGRRLVCPADRAVQGRRGIPLPRLLPKSPRFVLQVGMCPAGICRGREMSPRGPRTVLSPRSGRCRSAPAPACTTAIEQDRHPRGARPVSRGEGPRIRSVVSPQSPIVDRACLRAALRSCVYTWGPLHPADYLLPLRYIVRPIRMRA